MLNISSLIQLNCARFTPIAATYSYISLDRFLLFYLILTISIGLIISFLITLLFYLSHKHKKDNNHRKYALKKSWPFIVFVTILILIGTIIIREINNFCNTSLYSLSK